MAEETDGQVRLAGPDDLAFITACTRAAYQVYIGRLGRAPEPMTTDYREPVARGEVWILEQGGSRVGLLVLRAEPDHLLIYSVAVDPARQGQGLGHRLMGFAADEARRRGLGEVRLYTNERMTENIAFYRSLGYHETRREPFRGLRTVHMSLEVPAHSETQ